MIIVKKWETEVRGKYVRTLMYRKTHMIVLLFGVIPIFYAQKRI